MNRAAPSALPLLLCLAALTVGPMNASASTACPKIIQTAERLVLVLAPTMTSASARVQYLERDAAGGWHKALDDEKAVLGRAGLGWSWAFADLAGETQPIKREGDRRTPAGFFEIGGAFGFGPSERAGYTRLKPGEHFCVDDPASPHYNTVLPQAEAGKAVSGEDMATIPLYRQGLFLDYPTSRKHKGGSCIFVHVWRRAGAGTLGCVALAEAGVKKMQRWTKRKRAVMAILPAEAWARLRPCLKGLP